jgi:hypothetical protein
MYKLMTLINKIINTDIDNSPKYKCDYITMSVKGYMDILNNNGYKNSYKSKNWNIWFPSSYNNIDEQLKKLKIYNNEQIIFTIPNCDKIVSKHNVWKTLENYYGRDKASTIIPESYLLDDDKDLEKIKDSKNKRFILKKKKQRKEGLRIISDINEIKKIENEEEDFLIAQKLIDPFLVNGRKINLRIYMMLILKNNELSVYLNKFGTCIYTKELYDENSNEFVNNITSYKLDLDIYNENPLTFEQLKTYLKNNNLDHNVLFDKIKNKTLLFINSMKSHLGDKKFENNLCAQVFGLDFIIDKNLEPFLLECNKGPDMKPKITLIEYPEIDENIKNYIIELKNILDNNDITDLEKVKNIKKSFYEIYKDLPKDKDWKEILNEIEIFLKNENPLNSFPSGYITGNGLKAQKDSLNILNLVESDNNGYEKIN